MSQSDDPAEVERAAFLLAHLRRNGFTVMAGGGRLTVTPGSRLTDGEAAEVKEYKALLLRLLAAELPPPEWADGDREQVRLAGIGAFGWYVPGIADRLTWKREGHDGKDEGPQGD